MSNPSLRFSPRAEELFDDYVRRRDASEEVDFEAVCREQPEFADELRALLAASEFLSRLLPGALDAGSLSERLKQKHGEGVHPGVSLGHDGGPDSDEGPPSALLEKLRGEGPRGTRYKLLGEIARGGMGVVLRVWDDELRRKLAMKVVLAKGDARAGESCKIDPKTLGRFLEEAQITGQLDHPGIVPVHELGPSTDGRVYFTMRLVKGENLREIFDHVRDGADDWNQMRALNVMLKVCEAMSYAHDKDVIHRDLKPANVMVGKYGEVYVMDWGLARVLGREDKHDLRIRPESPRASAVETERDKQQRDPTPDSPLLTMDGDVVGTPSYMPPEQAQGHLSQLGPHSDVYSVGAMLYQLISGRMPFVPSDGRASQRSILRCLIEGPPKPLHELAPRAPVELLAICDKAMSREIASRYSTMQALGDDLRAFIEGRVVRAHETGAWAEARKWVKRNKLLSAALATALVALAVGLLFSLHQAERAGVSARLALLARQEAVANATVATKLKDDAIAHNQALWAAQEIAELRRRSNDAEFVMSLKRPAYEWWLETACGLVDGRHRGSIPKPGLADYEQTLARLQDEELPRSPGRLAAIRAAYPRAKELEYRRGEVLWSARMLGFEPWPTKKQTDVRLAAEPLPTSCLALNKKAFDLVRPDEPRLFGDEALAVAIGERAVSQADDPISRARCLDTLAFALARVADFDTAMARETEALGEAQRASREARTPSEVSTGRTWETNVTDNLRLLENERDLWTSEGEQWMHAELEAELQTIQRESDDWNKWRYEDSAQAELEAEFQTIQGQADDRNSSRFENAAGSEWRRYVTALVEDLRDLQRRIRQTERALVDDEAHARWDNAIRSIAADPRYGFLQITPQLDLVPLDRDPESGLWEFVHLPTGLAPLRRSGKLILTRHTGLVFVLLPPGRVTIADKEQEVGAFFLSKYEMTNEQWDRATHSWPPRSTETFPLRPVVLVSYDDCTEALRRGGAWLVLPSEAQWMYGCLADAKSCWWTGNTTDSTRGRENLLFAGNEDGRGVLAVGSLRPNAFGLYDMHGNVSEWCQSDSASDTSLYLASENVRHDDNVVWKRVVGGGNWDTSPDHALDDHGGVDRWHRDLHIGLRPARPLTP